MAVWREKYLILSFVIQNFIRNFTTYLRNTLIYAHNLKEDID